MSRCFHIASLDEVASYKRVGAVVPTSLAKEGFIHCSFADQLEFVLGSFFAGRDDLVLLEFDPEDVSELVVDSVVEAGDAFPHVYAEIPWAKIRGEVRVPRVFSENTPFFEEVARETSEAAARRESLEKAFPWTSHAEGMRFVETERNAERTSGHYWFVRGLKSVFHRVTSGDELWLIHEGALRLYVFDRGRLETFTLGSDVGRGERPVVSVPRGALQAAELVPGRDYAFGTNVCAPPFHFESFEIPTREELLGLLPAHQALVRRLSHP